MLTPTREHNMNTATAADTVTKVHAHNGIITLPKGLHYTRDQVLHGSYQGQVAQVARGTERVKLVGFDNEAGTAIVSKVLVGCGSFAHLTNVRVFATSDV